MNLAKMRRNSALEKSKSTGDEKGKDSLCCCNSAAAVKRRSRPFLVLVASDVKIGTKQQNNLFLGE